MKTNKDLLIVNPLLGQDADNLSGFLQNILESSTEYSIIGKDLAGGILLWNAGARRLYGYESAEVVGQANSAMLHTPEDVRAGKPQEIMAAALRSGKWEGTVRRVRKNGEQFTARLVITPRRDAAGKPVGFLLMSKDVTNEEKNVELAQANEELRAGEARRLLQATALETAANAIIITDAKAVMRWVNPAFTKLTGYTAEEAIGQTPRLFKSGQHDQAFYRDFWKTILSGQTWSGEFINRRKDGSIYYDENTVTPVRSDGGAITHFVGIMHDITERKRVEAELRVAHEKLSHLLAHSPAVIYTLKLEGQKITPLVVSDNIERFLGVTAVESARYEWWLESLHPEDRDRVVATVAKELARDGYSMEYRIRHKDGSYRWVEDNNRVVREESGRPKEAVGVWTDIGERKSAEKVFKQRAAELERFHHLSVGRELQMIELKKEVNELAKLAGRTPPYDMSFLQNPPKL